MLKIFNTLTGAKQVFTPIRPGRIGMYVCGVTVYDYCHVGHARFLVVFDMVRRYLRYRGYQVNYVRNITDIDDKIIQRAAQNGETIDALTARFITAMDEDCAALNCERPDHEPRATAHVPDIIALIEELVRRELAYVAADGDVCYAVAKFPGYGRLSGKRLDDLRAGARVDVDTAKRDPLDFVLWKRAKPGEPSWESPWGAGRPGWHIECSEVPASRKRDCAVLRCRRGIRQRVDAQRLRQCRRCQDVEVAGKFLHPSRGAAAPPSPRSAARLLAGQPLPRPDQLFDRPARTGGRRLIKALYRAAWLARRRPEPSCRTHFGGRRGAIRGRAR